MSTPGTLNYPGSLDDSVSLLGAVNNAAAVLADDIDSGATTVTVDSTASFTATGLDGGTIGIDDEIIYYSGTTGTAFTGCLRGKDGTAAASHTGGAQVQMLIAAAHHNILAAAIVALETKVGTGGADAPTGTGLRHITDSVEDSTAYTLVAGDIPDIDASKITSGVLNIARLATGTPSGAKFVRDDSTLATPSGGGDVSGPGSSVADDIATYADGTGTSIKDGGMKIAALEQVANKNAANGYAGLDGGSLLASSQMPLFGASGSGHAPGAVPDPGGTSGSTKYLREDGTWDVPSDGGGSLQATVIAGETATANEPVFIAISGGQLTAGQFYRTNATYPWASKNAFYAGFLNANTTAAASGLINLAAGQVISGFTGLSAGYLYYMDTSAGGMTLTPGPNGVLLGIAVSSTTILTTPQNSPSIAQGKDLTAVNNPNASINSGRLRNYLFYEGSGSTIHDLCGNADGTMTGGTWNATGDGYSPDVTFNGTSDYVSAADTSLPSGAAARTFYARIKTSDTTSAYRMIMSYGTGGSIGEAVEFGMQPNGFGEDGKLLVTQYGSGIYSTMVINDGEWHDIFVTFDGSYWNIYVDSSTLNSQNTMTTNTVLSGTMVIGNHTIEESGSAFWPGDISNISIWNRLLTAAEMDSLIAAAGGVSWEGTV